MSKGSKLLSASFRTATYVSMGLAVSSFASGETAHGVTRILLGVALAALAGYERTREDYRRRLMRERDMRLNRAVPRIANRIEGDR